MRQVESELRGSRKVCEGNRSIAVTEMEEARVEERKLSYSCLC